MQTGITLPPFGNFRKKYNKYIMSLPQYKVQALHCTDLLFPKPLIFQTGPQTVESQQVNGFIRMC